MTSPIDVVAHRGGAKEGPENSAFAIQRCARLGIPWVEVDVRRCRCGTLALFHDPEPPAGHGFAKGMLIESLTYEQLRTVDVGVPGTIEPPPTVEKILSIDRAGTRLMLEAKVTGHRRAFAESLATLLRDVEPDSVGVASFDAPFLAELNEFAPQIPLQAVFEDESGRVSFSGLPVNSWAMSDKYANAESVGRLVRDAGPVWVWTVDEPERIEQLASFGVCAVETDRPAWMMERLR